MHSLVSVNPKNTGQDEHWLYSPPKHFSQVESHLKHFYYRTIEDAGELITEF